MNPGISRRTAIKATSGALLGLAVGAATASADVAVAAKELAWDAAAAFGVTWEMTSRVVARLPASARYGMPISVGTVTVQATCPASFVEEVRGFTGVSVVSATGECTVTVVDARGLTGHATVGLTFPPTSLPEPGIDLTMTGSGAVTSPLPLPLPRNRGPMKVNLDREALVRLSGWLDDGTLWGEGFEAVLTMKPSQDPLLTTVDVR